MRRVQRSRLPGWLIYAFFTAVSIAVAGAVWQLTSLPGVPQRVPPMLLIGAQIVYPLAATQWLDAAAVRAFARFRPLLPQADAATSEESFRTLTPRVGALATAVGALLGIVSILITTDAAFVQMGLEKQLARPYVAGLLMVTGATWGPFVYRAVRQLNMVVQLHRRAVGVDPLRPAPAHAFAGWTMRLALVLAAFGYSWFAVDAEQQLANPVAAASEIGFLVLATACFIGPLLGMRQRLSAERTARIEAASERLERVAAEIHARVDSLDLHDADALNKTLLSVIAEREVLLKTGTWPWEQGTFNTFVSLFGAPILLFLATRTLGRLF